MVIMDIHQGKCVWQNMKREVENILISRSHKFTNSTPIDILYHLVAQHQSRHHQEPIALHQSRLHQEPIAQHQSRHHQELLAQPLISSP
ncbi:hypothetical protein DY000_02052585 [Brassica cretica]|uniref:Uncharacterized protein n=1 Tax=Brassica cretica TaxID=69181 RepID=A0ABQ7A7N5_BRACR|nr:hypothetical protein DY000_02052585 [Brassica cretica]